MPEPTDADRTGASPQAPVDLLVTEFTLDTLVALRHAVARCSESCGLAHLELYRFVLAVHELTTNAVRHGGGSGRLRLWRAGGRLYCEVIDHGPGMPPGLDRSSSLPRPVTIDGRGLWLARQNAEKLTIHSDDHGTRVVLTGRLPQAS